MSLEVITQHVSAAIFKIMGTTYWGHELDLVRSHDIIDRMTVQLTIMLFPIVSHWNRASILNRFRDRDRVSKYIWAMTLTFQGTWRHRSHDHLIPQVAISYRCSIVTESLSSAIGTIMGHKHIDVTTWLFRVTWRHRSRDQSICHMPFPIVDPLIPSLYLQPFSRYLHPNISGSRPCPFRVTWRHRSRDHFIHQMPLPTSDVQNNIFTGFIDSEHVG